MKRRKSISLWTVLVVALGVVLLSFQRCNNYETILPDYILKDSAIEGGFYFYRDSTITINENQFYKFRLNLLDNRTYFDGYLTVSKSEFIFYYPDIDKKTKFQLGNEYGKCDSAIVYYYIVADSTYPHKEIKEVCKSGSFISGKADTVFKMVIHNFSLLTEGDDLALYFNKRKGIVGCASQLKDGNLLYYRGNIYSDTLKMLNKMGKILE